MLALFHTVMVLIITMVLSDFIPGILREKYWLKFSSGIGEFIEDIEAYDQNVSAVFLHLSRNDTPRIERKCNTNAFRLATIETKHVFQSSRMGLYVVDYERVLTRPRAKLFIGFVPHSTDIPMVDREIILVLRENEDDNKNILNFISHIFSNLDISDNTELPNLYNQILSKVNSNIESKKSELIRVRETVEECFNVYGEVNIGVGELETVS